jgi:membrane-bound lytic murein transglycosylase B
MIKYLTIALLACSLLAHSANARSKPAEKHPGMTALALEASGGDAERNRKYLALLNTAVYQQSIIDAISRPAESKQWKDYRPIFITQDRIDSGVKFWAEHEAVLQAAEEKYKVSAAYIVAIIGVETFYGRNKGKFKVLDALTTLAFYYPKRAPFFSGELKQFLQFDQQAQIRVDPETTLGSYAGAMGLGQFIPTSYVNFAADGDNDGRIDLFNNEADAIHSVARYFNVHGWEYHKPVALAIELSSDQAVTDLGVLPSSTLDAVQKSGLTIRPSKALAKLKGDTKVSVIVLQGEKGTEAFASLQNFYVITRYNRSPLYAMAVNQLAHKIRSARAKTQK